MKLLTNIFCTLHKVNVYYGATVVNNTIHSNIYYIIGD